MERCASRRTRRPLRLIASGACSLLCIGAFAQASAPQYTVDDTWTFERIASDGPGTRTTFTETVKVVDEQHIGVRVDPAGTRRRYTVSMNRLDTNKKEIPLLRFPLAVGNQWEGDWDWKSTTSSAFGTNTLSYKVVSKGTVQTPAGSFEAYKIEANGFVNDRGTAWGGPQSQPRRTETYWYAPTVKRIVKYEGKDLKWLPPNYVETWSSKYELKSFKLVEGN